jgi:hypothetical protein
MKIRRRPNSETEEMLLECAWCGDKIPDDVEVFVIGGKAKAEIDLMEERGKTIPLVLTKADKKVLAIIPTSDSPAAREGKDFLFTVCSQSCGQALSNALESDMKLADDQNRLR